MIGFKALSGGLAVVALAGCINSSGRPGPFVDVDAPAPFPATQGRYPTQGQAQAAVDAAVQQRGMESVYPSFSTIAPGRVPTYVALDHIGNGRACSGARLEDVGRLYRLTLDA